MRMFRPALAFACLAALPLPAVAESYVCTYLEECYGADPCMASDFQVWFGPLEGDMLLSSEGGERRFVLMGEEEGYRAYYSPPAYGEVALLTLSPDNMITVALQGLYDGATRAAYSGRCAPE